MKESEIDNIVLEHKTTCCNARWYVEKRLKYRCMNCGKDVTFEIIYLTDVLMQDVKRSQNKWYNKFWNWLVKLFKK